MCTHHTKPFMNVIKLPHDALMQFSSMYVHIYTVYDVVAFLSVDQVAS
jgi:hypothetical protein